MHVAKALKCAPTKETSETTGVTGSVLANHLLKWKGCAVYFDTERTTFPDRGSLGNEHRGNSETHVRSLARVDDEWPVDVHTGWTEPLPEGGDNPLQTLFGQRRCVFFPDMSRKGKLIKNFSSRGGGYPLPLHLGPRRPFIFYCILWKTNFQKNIWSRGGVPLPPSLRPQETIYLLLHIMKDKLPKNYLVKGGTHLPPSLRPHETIYFLLHIMKDNLPKNFSVREGGTPSPFT